MVAKGVSELVVDSNCLENGNYISRPLRSKRRPLLESKFINRHYQSHELKTHRKCTLGDNPKDK